MTKRRAQPRSQQARPPITLRLPRSVLELVDRIAAQRGTRRSDVLHDAVQAGLSAHHTDNPVAQEYRATVEAGAVALAWLDRIAARRGMERSALLASMDDEKGERCEHTQDLFN